MIKRLFFLGFLIGGAIGILSAQPVRIGFLGDVMLGRTVDEKLSTVPTEYVWGDVLPMLKANDLNLANLETAFTKSINAVPKVFNFKSDPKNVAVLHVGNIGLVNLANNHSLDFGNEGLYDTLWALDRAGIKHVGAGKSEERAVQPVIVKTKGLRIGVLGYTDNEPGWKAGKDKPGVHYVKIGDIVTVRNDIAKLRPKVDILIVSLHWGPNMRVKPSAEFVRFAHDILDAGADIIHGHSAHIFQGIERYKNKLIMYDTGDFVDDYMVDPVVRNDQSFLSMVDVEKNKIMRIALIPVLISNMQVNRAADNEAHAMIKRIQKLSSELGTQVTDDGAVIY